MKFVHDILSIDATTDPRICKLILKLACPAGGAVRADDIFEAAIASGDTSTLEVLEQCLPTNSSEVVLRELESREQSPEHYEFGPRRRNCFSAEAIELIEGFNQARLDGVASSDCQLEYLVLLVLQHPGFGKTGRWPTFDSQKAIELLRRRIVEQAEGHKESFAPNFGQSSDAAGKRGAGESPSFDGLPVENLTERVRNIDRSRLSPLDGDPHYEQVFDRLARGLFRARGHVLLIGDAGMGQTMILTELALRAVRAQIPFLARSCLLFSDCRYVNPGEGRQFLQAILRQVASRDDVVLCIDGLASLLKSEHGGSDGRFLMSLLQRARCRFIGVLTPHAFEEHFSGISDSAEFFTSVAVFEPSLAMAHRIVECYADGIRQRFRLDFDRELARKLVVLSANYILNDRLPGKVFKLLQQICDEIEYDRSQLGKHTQQLTEEHVLSAVSRASGVPEETLRGIAEKSDYKSSLGGLIFGQANAVKQVADELGLIKAGLTEPTKPATVMLFIGQTGTGKTEMAKALARFYSTSKRLRTYTLGNFSEPHSVAGIIGVPPGYVGHDQGGRLVNDLNSDPYCVFLLDEADKAHPDVLQPFLNLFDEGWIRDQQGTLAFADKAIFILTTNVGQKMIGDLAMSGKDVAEITDRMKEALSQIRHSKSNRPVFAPEFLARIKRFVVFMPLGYTAMAEITSARIADMQCSWRENRGKELKVSEDLVRHIAQCSFDRNEKSKGKEGGRIVRKLVADWVETPLQRQISDTPDDYRACDCVMVEPSGPISETSDGSSIRVSFGKST